MAENKALGMIEVYGRTGAVEGLDSSLKAANVSLVNMVRVGGGFTSFFVEGDVGAVRAAIDAAASAAEKVGTVIGSHVIPRPAQCVRQMLEMELPVSETASEAEPEAASEDEPESVSEENLENNADRLESMTVAQLRSCAREIENFPLSRKEIKFAKKNQLIDALKPFDVKE